MNELTNYLTALISEKGKSVEDTITDLKNEMFGPVFGVTYQDLIEFLGSVPQYHQTIRGTLVKIDFQNGDVFHYLHHLANGMVNA